MAKKLTKKTKKTPNEVLDLTKESGVHEFKPRDKFGAPTGKRFDYQYEQTAKACLELLEDDDKQCVFCEWHDDFVVEKKGGAIAKALYAFNQIKTKQGSTGPWNLYDLFGVNKTKLTALKKVTDSHLYKLIRHFVDFGKTCESIVFITNGSLEPELDQFLKDISEKNDHASLTTDNQDIFNKLFSAYSQAISTLDNVTLFSLLKKLRIIAEDTPLSNSKKIFHTELMDKLLELSEIDLKRSESIKIGNELLVLVRSKAHYILETSVTETQLRKIKGVDLTDVLSLLSLSKSAYEALKQGGDLDAIKKLSRLQRLLEKSGITGDLVRDFCELKVSWDGWQRQVRHNPATKSDLITLKTDAASLLKEWTTGQININDVPSRSDNLAQKYLNAFTDVPPLNKDLVFGCVLAIAVED